MTDQHPITPPPELVQKWANSSPIQHSDESWAYELFIAHQAARWGADQELEACCEWLEDADLDDFQKVSWVNLRAARRPKSPSLKGRAQAELDRLIALIPTEGALAMAEPIRRALEQLDD